jgi:uncharacterized surface protein with fasciclin (FAS1) repeats
MLKTRTIGLLTALVLSTVACSDDDDQGIAEPPVTLPGTVVDIATSSADFSTLVGALQSAGLVETLQGPGPFTVFAPTNAAFNRLGSLALDKVTGDVNTLTDVLTYHVVPGSFSASDVVSLTSAPTVNGKQLSIAVQGGEVFVDGVRVTTTDLFAQNGVVHVLEGVLLPEPVLDIVETAESAGAFNTLLTAVDAAGLTETLKGEGPFTVFAPSDAAFDNLSELELGNILADSDLLTRVLTYHVVAGDVRAADVVNLTSATTVNGKELAITVENGEVFLDGIRVVTTDILTTNGVIHVIEDVLLPEPVLDIVDAATDAGSFSTLLTAVDVAGLTETLRGDGPFTVLAPTDDAFAKIPAETLNALLADVPALTGVLTYHVIGGAVPASTVVTLDKATTLQGTDVSIAVEGDGTVRINDASVLITDVETTNGIIHVIDTVLIPEA